MYVLSHTSVIFRPQPISIKRGTSMQFRYTSFFFSRGGGILNRCTPLLSEGHRNPLCSYQQFLSKYTRKFCLKGPGLPVVLLFLLFLLFDFLSYYVLLFLLFRCLSYFFRIFKYIILKQVFLQQDLVYYAYSYHYRFLYALVSTFSN